MTTATSLRPEASAVLRYLESHPGATARQIADFAGTSTHYVISRLHTLYSRGLVGRQHRYAVDDQWHWFPSGVKK